jgi:hypothetical protein
MELLIGAVTCMIVPFIGDVAVAWLRSRFLDAGRSLSHGA